MIKLLLLAIFEDVTKCFSNPRPRRVEKYFWKRLFLNNNLLKNNWIRLQYWQKIWTCCIKKHSSVFLGNDWVVFWILLKSSLLTYTPFLWRNHACLCLWIEHNMLKGNLLLSVTMNVFFWTPTKNFGTFWKRLSIFGTFWNQHFTRIFQPLRIFLISMLAILAKIEPRKWYFWQFQKFWFVILVILSSKN